MFTHGKRKEIEMRRENRSLWIGTVSCLVPAALAPRSALAVVSVTNVGLACNTAQTDGERIVFEVYEGSEGADFNGDGDQLDQVLHLLDTTTGDITNLGVAVPYSRWEFRGSSISYLLTESYVQLDLNGDGDKIDTIAHVYDIGATTPVIDLGLAVAMSLGPLNETGRFSGLLVAEAATGPVGTDMNDDGDANDIVMHVFDKTTPTVPPINLELAAGSIDGSNDQWQGDHLAFSVSEGSQGDHNDDGDTYDSFVYLYDAATGVKTQVGEGGRAAFTGNLLAFRVREQPGGTDLNDDGDMVDRVVHVYDLATGTLSNTRLAAATSPELGVVAGRVAVVVSEAYQGATDLNGDGDHSDYVPHVFDPATGVAANTGVALPWDIAFEEVDLWAFSQDQWVIPVWEAEQGATDLNRDGDASDVVIHVYDSGNGKLSNLRLASSWYVPRFPEAAFLPFFVKETDQGQGGTDFNGDGDTDDSILHVFEPATGSITNLGVQSFSFDASGDHLALPVSEAYEGTDLNGDGDAVDRVAHVYDTATDSLTNLGLATHRLEFQEGRLILIVPEREQGADLNGDGDQLDYVLHLADLAVDAGNNTSTGWNFAVGDDVTIGNNGEFGNDVTIGEAADIGNNLTAGDNVIIGTDAEAGNSVIIGDNVSIGNNVTIGNNVVIEDGVTIGNDVVIGNNVTIGAGACIADGASVTSNSVVPAGTPCS